MATVLTETALQDRSLNALRRLYRAEMRRLIRSDCGSAARRVALANLETVSLAIARRMLAGHGTFPPNRLRDDQSVTRRKGRPFPKL